MLPQRLDGADEAGHLAVGHADVGEDLLVEGLGGVLDGGAAEVGDLDEGGAPVGRVRDAADEAAFLEATDRVGDARDVDLQTIAGLGDRECALT